MRFISFAVLIKRIRAIKSLLLDPSVPKRKKILVIFGIIYLLSPIDLIPAPVFGLSIIDDLILWVFIFRYLSDELDSYWKEKEDRDQSEVREVPDGTFDGRDVYESEGKDVTEEDD